MTFAFSALALAFFAAMVLMLIGQSVPVWRHEGFGYLTGTQWFFQHHEFGARAMIYGTVVVSTVALALAAPIGWGAALFTSEVLPGRWRLPVKASIELLAGIPSVIYGLLGILLLRERVYDALQPFEPVSGDTLLTAGILLAVMVLPTVMTLCDDALRGGPGGTAPGCPWTWADTRGGGADGRAAPGVAGDGGGLVAGHGPRAR